MHKGHRARELFSSSMINDNTYQLYKYICLYLTIRLLYYLIKSTRSIYDIYFKYLYVVFKGSSIKGSVHIRK